MTQGLAPPRRSPSSQRVRRFAPTKGLRLPAWSELWAYRSLLWLLMLRDFRVRHQQTLLGAAWAVLQPLLQMGLLTLVFGRLARLDSDGHPYALFVLSALLPWIYFSNAVSTGSSSLIAAAPVIRRIYFPRIFLPLAAAGALLVDVLIGVGLLVALLPVLGPGIGLRLLSLPLLLAGVFATALGVGALLAALSASYRDFRNTVPFLLQLWMFATPIVYSPRIVPEQFRWLLWLNPMAAFVEGFRSALLDRPFDAWALTAGGLTALAFLLTGLAGFHVLERRFADVI